MSKLALKIFISMQTLLAREEGQDLVEYCLVVALVAFAGIAGMKSLASGINIAFNGVSSGLAGSL
jgi:pilus assembly protein Flp/PilA